MTALNVVMQRERVHVITDGVSYRRDGTISGFCCKARPITHLSAVVATNGDAWATSVLAHELDDAGTFDELVADGEGRIMDALQRHSFILDGARPGDIWLAGWSTARARPELYHMYGKDDHIFGGAPEKVCKLEDLSDRQEFWNRPHIPADDYFVAFATPPLSPEHVVDIDLYARTIVELQRQQKYTGSNLYEPMHVMGGNVQVTTIDASGLHARVVHRWAEDRVGDVIRPQPIDWAAWRAAQAAPTATSVVQLSKLQREIAERKAKKAARRAGR